MYNDIPNYLIDYLNYLETIQNNSSGTVKEYYYDLRLFLRYIKVVRTSIEDLTLKDFDIDSVDVKNLDFDIIKYVELSQLYQFMSFVTRDRENSSTSRARKVASIKSFYRYLKNKAKILSENPAADLESPKIDKTVPKYLNIAESKSLLNSVTGEFVERDYAILILFLNCGLRLSELVSIDINNIKNDSIVIKGKGSKERTVYLNESCIEAIDVYMKIRPKNNIIDREALFLSKRKKRISNKTVQYLVKKYIKLSGLDPKRYSTHKLRHTAATLMYRYGNVDIRSLQEILGHESITTTEIYTHIDNNHLRNATKKNPLSDYKKENINHNKI
ncbi:MAG: tyrosine recombinase XerC [Clostridiales bacterium]